MISVQGVSKFLGKSDLFRDVSFHVHPGDRIGLIGPNGSGKSTLFQILLGELEPDDGIVTRSKFLTIGHLPQQWTPQADKSVLAYTMDVDQRLGKVRAELERLQKEMDSQKENDRIEEMALRQAQLLEQLEHLGGYDLEARARKILAGLGFQENRLHSPLTSLSGGWVMRVALARLLLAEPDLLLLDEPTNHLDLDSLLWLEQYLATTPSAMIIIAHDRAFLNRLVQRIIELDQGEMHEYSGNYDAYLVEKSQRVEMQRAAYKNQQMRIRQIERFIERNRYRKDRARQVQSRLKTLEKMERIEDPQEQSSVSFSFPDPPQCGKHVLELSQVRKSYGKTLVYDGIDLVIERGDRIAFLGKNGAGKSTLLKILAGREGIDQGERKVGHRVVIGYYAQYQWEQLHSDRTVLEEATSIAGDLPQTQLRALLGAFLFRGEDVDKRISVLSGGEKARLIICKLLVQRPNLLLMDEPTNHLDIPSRDVLEKALRRFSGTICFISHDRHFINAIANKILVVKDGAVHLFPGNYDDYMQVWKQRLESDESAVPSLAEVPAKKAPGSGATKKYQQQKKREAEWRNELYRLKKPLQENLEKVDARLTECHQLLDSINEQLADPATYQNGERVRELQRAHHDCQKQIKELTREWESTALALEELEENFWKEKNPAKAPEPL